MKATDSDNRRTKGNQSESVDASNAASTDIVKTWISAPIINTSTSPLIPTGVSGFTSDISISNANDETISQRRSLSIHSVSLTNDIQPI